MSCSLCNSASNGSNFDLIRAFFNKFWGYFSSPPPFTFGGKYFAPIKNFKVLLLFYRDIFVSRASHKTCSPCDSASIGSNFDLIRVFCKKNKRYRSLPPYLWRKIVCTNKNISKSCKFLQRHFRESGLTHYLFALRYCVE